MRTIFLIVLALVSFISYAQPIEGLVGAKAIEYSAEKELPYEAEVEYIGCDGGQYIDTGVDIFGASSFDYDVCGSSLYPVAEQRIFSTEGTSPTYDLYLLNSTTYQCRPSNTRVVVEAGDVVRGLYQDGIVWLYVNGEIKAQKAIAFTPVANHKTLYLMCRANNIDSRFRLIGRFYYAILATDGTLIRDMVPVRFRNEQGVSEGAMYDKVTGQLFRNQGTGSFSIGPDL